jgi:hypothetical protein
VRSYRITRLIARGKRDKPQRYEAAPRPDSSRITTFVCSSAAVNNGTRQSHRMFALSECHEAFAGLWQGADVFG